MDQFYPELTTVSYKAAEKSATTLQTSKNFSSSIARGSADKTVPSVARTLHYIHAHNSVVWVVPACIIIAAIIAKIAMARLYQPRLLCIQTLRRRIRKWMKSFMSRLWGPGKLVFLMCFKFYPLEILPPAGRGVALDFRALGSYIRLAS